LIRQVERLRVSLGMLARMLVHAGLEAGTPVT